MWMILLAGLAPLAVVLSSLLQQQWSWGLMDDHLVLGFPGGCFEKGWTWFWGILGNGALRPVTAFHGGIMYGLFEHAPGLCYIFRFIEVVAAVAVWALVAWQLTGRWITFFLTFAVAMSFNYIYDAFFFLSTQEILGIFFSGCSLFWVNKGFQHVFSGYARILWGYCGLALLFFVLALGCKETFIAFGLALGVGLMILSHYLESPSRRTTFILGFSFLVVSLLYGLMLKNFVMAQYTSRYSLIDVPGMMKNLVPWVQKVLLNHLPWLVMAGVLGSRLMRINFGLKERSGIALGLLPT